jgi:hypothetical protein
MVVESGIRIKPIPDPGSRGQKGTGSRIRIRNTAVLLQRLYFLELETRTNHENLHIYKNRKYICSCSTEGAYISFVNSSVYQHELLKMLLSALKTPYLLLENL